ncbi:MAG: diguanylate cyclase [Dictyoglomaceae bacterium]
MKVFLITIFINFLLLVGIFLIIFTQLRESHFHNFETLIETYSQHVSQEIYPYISQNLNLTLRKQAMYFLSFMKDVKGVVLLTSKFLPTFSYGVEIKTIPKDIFKNVKGDRIKYYDLKNHLYYYVFPLIISQDGTPLYYFLTVSDTRNIERIIGLAMNRILIYILLTQTSLSLLTYHLLRKDLTYPLDRLSDFVKNRDFSVKSEPFIQRKDEIGDLSRKLLELNDNLEKIITRQREIIENRTNQLTTLLRFLTIFNMAQEVDELINLMKKRLEETFPGKIKDKILINPWDNSIVYKDLNLLSEEETHIFLEYISSHKNLPYVLTEKYLSNFLPSFSSGHSLYILKRKDKIFGFVIVETKDLTPEMRNLLISIANHFTIALENILTYEQTKKLSITDSLTGVINKRRLEEILDSEIKRAIRFNHPLSVVFIDIDHFKRINDTFGHLIGDEFLRELALFLVRNLRNTDHVGRFGGEEFVAVLVETDLSGAKKVSEKLRRRWIEGKHVIEINPSEKIGTLSMGISNHPEHADNWEDLIRFADIALYDAKKERDKVSVFRKDMLQEIK